MQQQNTKRCYTVLKDKIMNISEVMKQLCENTYNAFSDIHYILNPYSYFCSEESGISLQINLVFKTHNWFYREKDSRENRYFFRVSVGCKGGSSTTTLSSLPDSLPSDNVASPRGIGSGLIDP